MFPLLTHATHYGEHAKTYIYIYIFSGSVICLCGRGWHELARALALPTQSPSSPPPSKALIVKRLQPSLGQCSLVWHHCSDSPLWSPLTSLTRSTDLPLISLPFFPLLCTLCLFIPPCLQLFLKTHHQVFVCVLRPCVPRAVWPCVQEATLSGLDHLARQSLSVHVC